MTTQMIDGSWNDTLLLPEALSAFWAALSEGKAKRFVVGSYQEIEEEKTTISIESELSEMRQRLSTLEARLHCGLVIAPSPMEVRLYGEAGGMVKT